MYTCGFVIVYTIAWTSLHWCCCTGCWRNYRDRKYSQMETNASVQISSHASPCSWCQWERWGLILTCSHAFTQAFPVFAGHISNDHQMSTDDTRPDDEWPLSNDRKYYGDTTEYETAKGDVWTWTCRKWHVLNELDEAHPVHHSGPCNPHSTAWTPSSRSRRCTAGLSWRILHIDPYMSFLSHTNKAGLNTLYNKTTQCWIHSSQ